MSKESIYRYPGTAVEVSWDKRLCTHVDEYTRARNDLLESGRNPWCDPDLVDAPLVAEVVTRCPTGALTYAAGDDVPTEAPADKNTVVVSNNGPLYARGELRIAGASDDMPGVRTRAAIGFTAS